VRVWEGSIDPDRAALAMRYYARVMDDLPSIETITDR